MAVVSNALSLIMKNEFAPVIADPGESRATQSHAALFAVVFKLMESPDIA